MKIVSLVIRGVPFESLGGGGGGRVLTLEFILGFFQLGVEYFYFAESGILFFLK